MFSHFCAWSDIRTNFQNFLIFLEKSRFPPQSFIPSTTAGLNEPLLSMNWFGASLSSPTLQKAQMFTKLIVSKELREVTSRSSVYPKPGRNFVWQRQHVRSRNGIFLFFSSFVKRNCFLFLMIFATKKNRRKETMRIGARLRKAETFFWSLHKVGKVVKGRNVSKLQLSIGLLS